MKSNRALYNIIRCFLLIFFVSCQNKSITENEGDSTLIMKQLGYPQAIFHDGKYYFTFQGMGGESVELYCTDDLTKLEKAEHRTLWSAQQDSMTHFWSPEIYNIGGKWYMYFEADDGNTDNHNLYVLECKDADPMKGTFVMKGVIETHAEWNYGIHPNLLQMPSGELYLLWSSWPKRRNETETQCIYIARMENPWTISSERVLISKPDYEWERQWINPNGNRSAYPIYVNENPEAFISPDGQRVVVLYSASGIWTVYTAMGMLTAPVGADLLNPSSWTKRDEPMMAPDTLTYSTISNVYLVPSSDGKATYMIYEKKWLEKGNIVRDTYMRPISWTDDGLPVFN